MKQGNNNSNPSTCSCVSLQLHLLSLPKSLFSDSRRAFVISIIAFIALGESFSLKNLPISEKMFVLLLLGIGLSIFLFDTSKLLIFRNIRIALCSFFHHYFIFFELAKLELVIETINKKCWSGFFKDTINFSLI